MEEALKAIEFPGVQSVQIIYNMLRQRPADLLFKETQRKGVGILARLPLSSGLLTGKMTSDTAFAADDHRLFNRNGEQFDKGETFSGLEYSKGLAAVEALRPLVPAGMSMAQWALRWVTMHPAVTCAIPGGKRAAQVEDNMRAADLPALSDAQMQAVQTVYEQCAKPWVHHGW